jgi:glucan phosphoethanolaminetransferase (alkaline phosphatase superfamily)
MSDTMSLIQDEQGNFSTARVLLICWTAVIFALIAFKPALIVVQQFLTFLTSVYLFLATWAAGPRMVQYLSPIVSQVVSAVGQAKTVSLSSDIQELKALKEKQKG